MPTIEWHLVEHCSNANCCYYFPQVIVAGSMGIVASRYKTKVLVSVIVSEITVPPKHKKVMGIMVYVHGWSICIAHV